MAIGDFFTQTRDGGEPVVATVSTPRSAGGTSLSCDDLDNWPQEAVHFITFKKLASGAINYDTLQTFKGIVSGNTIGTVTLQSSPTGSDLGNEIGDFVRLSPTSSWAQDLFDGLAVEHDVDGTHDATKIVKTTGNQTIAGTKTFSSAPVLPANSIPTAAYQDGSITNQKLATSAGEPGGAWDSWTPTLSGRFDNAKWDKICSYKQVGKTIFFRIRLVANAGTPMSGGSADATFTLPVTSAVYTNTTSYIIGNVGLFDTSSPFSYDGKIISSSTTTGTFKIHSAGATYTGLDPIISTAPFTWASGDEITGEGFYEAA